MGNLNNLAAMPLEQKIVKCPLCGWQGFRHADLIEHFALEHPGCAAPVRVTLDVNGKLCELVIEPQMTLKEVLQFRLGLTGAKEMCNRGACGSCTVIMDGRPT
ncbi:MAG: 2Fe-2S iron-sulfur cluster binding domain-containing protein, partial [Oscillospiraceae bacterium]|nr:2Fe-2S iron-sulfur cluster binding domain-containing protein [Oscillospiraceae bacterium]